MPTVTKPSVVTSKAVTKNRTSANSGRARAKNTLKPVTSFKTLVTTARRLVTPTAARKVVTVKTTKFAKPKSTFKLQSTRKRVKSTRYVTDDWRGQKTLVTEAVTSPNFADYNYYLNRKTYERETVTKVTEQAIRKYSFIELAETKPVTIDQTKSMFLEDNLKVTNSFGVTFISPRIKTVPTTWSFDRIVGPVHKYQDNTFVSSSVIDVTLANVTGFNDSANSKNSDEYFLYVPLCILLFLIVIITALLSAVCVAVKKRKIVFRKSVMFRRTVVDFPTWDHFEYMKSNISGSTYVSAGTAETSFTNECAAKTTGIRHENRVSFCSICSAKNQYT